MDRLLHGRPHVLMDQIAQRDRALLMRQPQLLDTVVHGAFLRWSPAKATWLVVPNRKNAPFSFSPRLGPRPPQAVRLAPPMRPRFGGQVKRRSPQAEHCPGLGSRSLGGVVTFQADSFSGSTSLPPLFRRQERRDCVVPRSSNNAGSFVSLLANDCLQRLATDRDVSARARRNQDANGLYISAHHRFA